MHVADEAWPELGDHLDETSLALVPVGSTEQHGPHLPEGTDHLIAEALADAVADRTDALLTPGIRIGVSSHHRQFPGTLWADPGPFRDYVESIARNLTYHGVDRMVFVNAHGGNVQHLREVGRRLHHDEAAYAVEWMWDESIPDLVAELFERNGPHGGPKETAMIQHIAPELVHTDRLDAARDGGTATVSADMGRVHGARTFYDAVDNSPNGVFGDQTDATPERGAQLFEAATDQLVALVEWLEAQPFDDLLPESPVEGDDWD
ncbi:MAG: creatininase family protein [Halobacteriaceae archaeon]